VVSAAGSTGRRIDQAKAECITAGWAGQIKTDKSLAWLLLDGRGRFDVGEMGDHRRGTMGHGPDSGMRQE